MLTVRYHRLGLRADDRVLDLGCGAGRHAFEAARRRARVVALDRDAGELIDVRGLLRAMKETGELGTPAPVSTVVSGDACRLPFPDATFDRVIAAEVLEHIDDDVGAMAELARVLRPGGTMAVTVPAWLPESVCWALSQDYHAPRVAGGHVRIYRAGGLRARLRAAGLEPRGAHHAHALHTPYWWLRCAVGPADDEHRLVRAYHRLLVASIVGAGVLGHLTRLVDRMANPLLGKSIVIYATRPDVPA